jgi:multidrug efflux pump subunit AcrA (membrane-fusion protein)
MLLKPQMFANVEMELDLGERLAIPATAILDTGTRQVVYVDIGDGYFTPRQVRLGVRTDGIVEVTNGLKAGEKVASMAVFLIDSEAKLKGVSQ